MLLALYRRVAYRENQRTKLLSDLEQCDRIGCCIFLIGHSGGLQPCVMNDPQCYQ